MLLNTHINCCFDSKKQNTKVEIRPNLNIERGMEKHERLKKYSLANVQNSVVEGKKGDNIATDTQFPNS